jgi:ribosomal protein L31E
MSEDEKLETELYAALDKVSKMPWPKQRARIFKNVCSAIMKHMDWETITIKPDEGK